MTKKLLIGVGILAGAGLAYYFWKKNQPVKEEEKSKATGRTKKTSRIGDALISTGRLKKGDKWFDSDSKECCEVVDNSSTIVCTKAPCTIKA